MCQNPCRTAYRPNSRRALDRRPSTKKKTGTASQKSVRHGPRHTMPTSETIIEQPMSMRTKRRCREAECRSTASHSSSSH
eukprot:7292898-Prymnesium_polylepis.1